MGSRYLAIDIGASSGRAIVGEVDLDATQDEGSVVFASYAVGFPEDLG